MARFDVYPNPDGEGYLLDVQADLLSCLRNRVVVPLQAKAVAHIPIARLNTVLEFGGEERVMMTHLLAAAPTSSAFSLAANPEPQRDVIVDAMLFFAAGLLGYLTVGSLTRRPQNLLLPVAATAVHAPHAPVVSDALRSGHTHIAAASGSLRSGR
jgi:toxin CcdB